MAQTSVVENIGAVAHRYEHRATRETYVWPAGEAREVPEEIALSVTAAHPNKMRLRDDAGRGAQAASPHEKPHVHRWNRKDVCRCGLRKEEHRPHSHDWRKDGACRCGLRREEAGRK